jgi:transposase-like protein
MNGLTLPMTQFSSPTLSPQDKRRLRALKQEGYLSDDNPLSKGVMRAVRAAAAEVPPPEWLNAFLTMDASGDGTESERLHTYNSEEDMTTIPLYVMLGRNDPDRTDTKQRVLACWIRRGLGSRVKDVALELDVAQSTVSELRTQWEWEIRALLQDALCLGLTGEDIYLAVTTPHYEPTRLMERILELRIARSAAETPGPLPSQYEQELREAWFDYRAKQGLKGRSPDMPVHPHRWFINQLVGG